MRFWIGIYIIMTFFDVIATYIFINEISDEGNLVIQQLMEQYGIWQGLSIYILQEFLLFFLIWGFFYYLLKYIMKGRPEQLQFKIDIFIFNLGVPCFIMASALLHFFGGIFWIIFGLTGIVVNFFPLKFILYITIICGIIQAYYALSLNEKSAPALNQTLISE